MPTQQSFNDILSGLEKILAAEKAALLAGAYDSVSAMTAEKERLAMQFEAALIDRRTAAQFPAYRKRIRKILEAAKENESLFAAAKSGVKSAQARISEILSKQQMIGVYAESGDKILAPGAGVSRQKFA